MKFKQSQHFCFLQQVCIPCLDEYLFLDGVFSVEHIVNLDELIFSGDLLDNR